MLKEKLKCYSKLDICAVIYDWYKKQPVSAKTAFLSALIIGFVSHLFIYTGRYYGRDDMGLIRREIGPIVSGRWFNGIITTPFHNFVLPLVSGILVALFLAIASFYICKLFLITKKINAVVIGGLLSTYPSIAITNLFLYETISYHFAVLLAVMAVYITVKYKCGVILGAFLAMLTIATYQSYFNVIIGLCLFYIIYILISGYESKDIRLIVSKFLILIISGAILYAVSVQISLIYYDTTLMDYRGMSPGSILTRITSYEEISSNLISTYKNFINGFFGNFFANTRTLKISYLFMFFMYIILFANIIIQERIYKNPLRLITIILLLCLVPLACNFSDYFDTGDAYGVTMYAYSLVLVFIVVLLEKLSIIIPIIRSIFIVLLFLIITMHITSNNIYYLKAHYSNQRAYSLTIRVLDRIEPLLPLTSSNKVAIFGDLPNEYLPGGYGFEYAFIDDGAGVQNDIFLNYKMSREPTYTLIAFHKNVFYNHGVNFSIMTDYEAYDQLKRKITYNNMPVFPAEGSVGIIDDVIVVNFGVINITREREPDDDRQYFLAWHYISEGHVEFEYEYRWEIYKDNRMIYQYSSDSNKLYIDEIDYDFIENEQYVIELSLRNIETEYWYKSYKREYTWK